MKVAHDGGVDGYGSELFHAGNPGGDR